MQTRKEVEELENRILASYSMKSFRSKGRKYKEKEHEYRSAFQRDRDRIIHSTAFRKLEYKTQVFVIHEGDYYRTRLTHTIETAQISRTLARSLRLNEDLTEAIALAHDLGHTPFGHSGEKVLNELMKNNYGFEHNRQSLRVVDVLEERYPDFPGLNLTYELRESLAKHSTSYDKPFNNEFAPEKKPLLEAQVVNLADEIAYNSHDLDDGLTSRLLSLKDLNEVFLWKDIFTYVKKKKSHLDIQKKKYLTIRRLINAQCSDLIKETEKNIRKLKIRTIEDVRNSKKEIVSFSKEMDGKNKKLKDFLFKKLYNHYKVVRMEDKAQRFISELFRIYIDRFDSLPPQVREKANRDSKERVICDYIAGMTDRFALEEYKKLTDPFERV